MSLDHAILGFLAEAPGTGYDLKKRFDASVQHFWPADRTHIYRCLSQLAAHGWARVEVVPQDGKPNQKRYTITADGEAELRRFLAVPQPAPEVREATLVQVFFTHLLSDAQAEQVLEGQLAAIQVALSALQGIPLERRPARDRRSARRRFFQRLTLEHGIAMRKAELGFLGAAIKRLRAERRRKWKQE